MKFIKFFIILFALTACKKEDENVSLPPRPSGKYLSEIEYYNTYNHDFIKLKYASLEYNSERYLTKVIYYSSVIKDNLNYEKYYYNNSGKISKIESFNNQNVLTGRETIKYDGDSLIFKESFRLDSINWVFEKKSKIFIDESGFPVKIYQTHFQDIPLDSLSYTRILSFNSKGSLYSQLEIIPGVLTTKETFTYDNKVNPFKNTGIDIVHKFLDFPWHDYIDFIPENNVVERQFNNSTRYYCNYLYDGDYPYYESIAPFEFFYQYTDL